jgi:hypothetical protein
MNMTEDQIKHMADRFLGWKLPENFSPDCGISFKRTHSAQSQWGPQKYEPTGTNLFDATQATEMVRYLIEGMPAPADDAAVAWRFRSQDEKCDENAWEVVPHKSWLPTNLDGYDVEPLFTHPAKAVDVEAVKLGSMVTMNDTAPFGEDWRGVILKVVGLHLAPDGDLWADVIEGNPRHRGNGQYDSETTDINVSHLSLLATGNLPTPRSPR